MIETLQSVSSGAVVAFVVTSMVAAGLSLTIRALVTPLRQRRLVLGAVVANFVVVPAIAFGLTRLVPLQRPHEIGLLLLGGAAGAPFLPKLATFVRGDLPFSVGLMLLLVVGSVGFMPLILPVMIPGLSADAWPILKPLLATMLVPLGAGMLLRRHFERRADRLRQVFSLVSNISMVLAVVLLIGLNSRAMLHTLGSGAIAVGIIFVLLAVASGYAFGGLEPGKRSVLAMGTGQRNIAAALVIATQNFTDPGVVTMLLVTTFAGLFVLLIVGRRMSRRSIAPLMACDPIHPVAGLEVTS